MRLRRLNHGPAQSRQQSKLLLLLRHQNSRHGEIFFSKAICLALVTMTCQPSTRICDGSSRRSASISPDPRYPKRPKSRDGWFKFPVSLRTNSLFLRNNSLFC